MPKIAQISVHNPYQDMGQTDYTGFFNNLSFTPTVEELNRTTASRGEVSQPCSAVQEENEDRLFGTHIREAATTLKKLIRPR